MSEPKYTRKPVIDPAVAELLESMQKKVDAQQLPRKKREALARERAKIEARRDFRTTYDLPPAVREAVRDLAEREGVPASQLATLALIRFLKDLEKNAVDLDALKEPSRSPRYDWNLNLPDYRSSSNDAKKRKT